VQNYRMFAFINVSFQLNIITITIIVYSSILAIRFLYIIFSCFFDDRKKFILKQRRLAFHE